MTRETAKAVYVTQFFMGDFAGTSADSQWLPKSQLSDVVLGKSEVFHDGKGEKTITEFHARIPMWLANKLFPVRTGPIPYATRPW